MSNPNNSWQLWLTENERGGVEGGAFLASFPGPAQLSVTCSTLAILQVTEAGWGLGTSLGNISFSATCIPNNSEEWIIPSINYFIPNLITFSSVI